MSESRNSSKGGSTDSNPGVDMDVREANAKYLLPAEGQVPKGYKQSEVGMIPEDWNAIQLTTVAKLESGHTPSRRILEYWNGNIPWVSLHDTGSLSGKEICSTKQYVTQRGIDNSSARLLPKGTVIFSRTATVGKTTVLGREMATSQDFANYICGPSIHNHFLVYLFRNMTQEWKKLMAGSIHNTVYMPVFKSLRIALPPIHEQEAIAEALSDVDALIEALGQLIAKKRQLKQGAMQELLTGKRRLPGFSGEWRTVLLGDVIIHCSSGATPYRGQPEFYKGTVKWITSGELNYNVITDTIEHISHEAVEKTNLKIHPSGTFLMAITGLEAAGTRGSCGIVGSPATTNQSCMAIYPTPELKTEYLFHYYVSRGNDLAFQYCQGTKQQSYTAKLVKLLPIDLPPTSEEQTAIAQILTDMDTEITELETKLTKARAVKQGMMQQLLTGKIRLVVNPKPIIDN